MFKVLRDSLLSIVYPQECRVCSRHVESHDDGDACARCWSVTRIFDGSEMLCAKCGAVLATYGTLAETFCHNCDDHYYDKAVAAGVYEKALAASVIRLKTSPVLSVRTAEVFIDTYERSGFGATNVIIPVPLSKQRRIERGYNQAEILGRILSKKKGIRIDAHTLIRTRHSAMHRVAMDMRARELTVQNAFHVDRPKLVEGQSILLVDDVFTSGSTTSHCSKVLKKCGAGEVNVLTLARAVSE